MSKPVPDKAEIALEYPDKFYVGTFGHSSRFEARLDGSGVALVLQHPGTAEERKSVHLHLNFGLLAGILRELAGSVAASPRTTSRTGSNSRMRLPSCNGCCGPPEPCGAA